MRIYIRHAEKAYHNGKSDHYKHDPPLTVKGKNLCTEKVIDLVETLGVPTKILCSPYKRCRETAEQFRSELWRYNINLENIPILIDTNLSEYLGNHSNTPLDVLPETQNYNIPHPEQFNDFIERVSKHNSSFDNKSDEIIWIVTHGIVLGTVCQLNGLFSKKKYDYLENIIID